MDAASCSWRRTAFRLRDGLAAELAGRVVAGGHTLNVARVRITDAGRQALAEEA